MLTFLLDQLSSPTPTVNGQKLWVQPTNSGKTLQSNPINILFCGTMKSNCKFCFDFIELPVSHIIIFLVRCVSCGDMHINTENFQEFNLNLNLKPPNNSRLEDYIAAYFKTELLESFKCQQLVLFIHARKQKLLTLFLVVGRNVHSANLSSTHNQTYSSSN
jgi:hypothetical protein